MAQTRKRRTKSGRRPLTPRAVEILEKQREAFIAKFGRDPTDDDPVFFDPNADKPQQIDVDAYEAAMLSAMASADLPPQFLFAYRKTGLLVTASNREFIPPEDLAEWEAAIDEFLRLEDESESSLN